MELLNSATVLVLAQNQEPLCWVGPTVSTQLPPFKCILCSLSLPFLTFPCPRTPLSPSPHAPSSNHQAAEHQLPTSASSAPTGAKPALAGWMRMGADMPYGTFITLSANRRAVLRVLRDAALGSIVYRGKTGYKSFK